MKNVGGTDNDGDMDVINTYNFVLVLNPAITPSYTLREYYLKIAIPNSITAYW